MPRSISSKALALTWLDELGGRKAVAFGAAGVAAALVVHHFGFLRIVDRNLGRILPMQGKQCLFAFMSWRSYLLIAVMMLLGIVLRRSPLPRPYLSIVYIAIGLALVLSSVRYLRVLASELRKSI